jgi:Pentapeptide repeats (9 copies)
VSWQGLIFDFTGVVCDGGDFDGAQFSGGTVDFGGAPFSGGTVDFSHPGDWSFPPAFPWTDTPPPSVKLPKKEDQSHA